VPEAATEEAEPEDEPETTPSDDGGDLLVPEDQYLSSGVHIGTQQKNAAMEPFIYRVRDDGLFVLDVSATDRRIRTAARFLSNYDPENVVFVSARQYGQKPIQVIEEHLGVESIPGRFMPGMMTNPETRTFFEPEVIVLNDPVGDQQSLREALNIGIPVVALCDTNNELKNVDLCIPTNNKGRRSLALVYHLLARELGKEWGVYESDDDVELEVEDFEASL
jgi:small subunit ribosomal protein S2